MPAVPTPLQICYLPAQWRVLEGPRLRDSACVVIDVIRATSTIVSALAHGAAGVQPIADSADAFVQKALNPDALLAGERHGRALPGFDLGNSPEDYTEAQVKGRHIILTTTNGTPALEACRGARAVMTGCLLNLDAVALQLLELGPPWTIVCAGHEGGFGIDDAIVAGALAEALDQPHAFVSLYRAVKSDLPGALLRSWAGRQLVRVGVEKDVEFCAKLNVFPLVPTLGSDGILRVS